jgi:coproporphyrinogen III oxidase-like Fe-S oxidoreductase
VDLRALPGGRARSEYTVEVNPEHASPALYAAIRAIGGTRVSLGVQSLDPEGLRALGRGHEPGRRGRPSSARGRPASTSAPT